MPCTMIWSIRAIGNDAGQLNPHRARRALGGAHLGGDAFERAVVHRAVQVAEQDHL